MPSAGLGPIIDDVIDETASASVGVGLIIDDVIDETASASVGVGLMTDDVIGETAEDEITDDEMIDFDEVAITVGVEKHFIQ